jgi:Alpha amylase, C-terminal all-beta domain
VFVENHDTERGSDTLSYRDGATNTLATEFMLARGYGTPQVYSSFRFTSNDASPPADRNGYITDTTCDAGWACTDRIPGVANMVGWHNYVGGAELRHWYDDGVNLIAFSRGAKGWIALNNSTTTQTHTFTTGLSRGTYCDLIHGTINSGTCTGPPSPSPGTAPPPSPSRGRTPWRSTPTTSPGRTEPPPPNTQPDRRPVLVLRAAPAGGPRRLCRRRPVPSHIALAVRDRQARGPHPAHRRRGRDATGRGAEFVKVGWPRPGPGWLAPPWTWLGHGVVGGKR